MRRTIGLIEDRAHFYAVANVVARIVAGLGAAIIGISIAAAIWS